MPRLNASMHGPSPRSTCISSTSALVASVAATVLCLNVLGDGVRDALDPRARLRVPRR